MTETTMIPRLPLLIEHLACHELHAGSPNQEVQHAYGKGFRRCREDAAELARKSLVGWKFERRQQGPIVTTYVTAPNGYTAVLTPFDRNPNNVFLMLIDALMEPLALMEPPTA